jgi:16S rRNA (cytosine1402-N4)-methyltransferase
VDGVHVTVLLEEVAAACTDLTSGWVVDGTVGQGGHAEAILSRTPPAVRLMGFDRDPQALEASSLRLAAFGDRFVPIHRGYDSMREVLDEAGVAVVDRVCLDLGLSTTQLDSDRGFSFAGDQPLDMRFDPTEGLTAAERLHEISESELANVLFLFGEVPASRRLAHRMKEEARANRMETTADLVRVCREVLGPMVRKMPSPVLPAQALRILVNGEFERLDTFIASIPSILAPGGRVAVISFHSGEDRRVKQGFKALATTKEFRLPQRKPIGPTEEEQRRNRRSRAAHLRILERPTEES